MRKELRIQDDGDVSSMSTMRPEEEKRMSEWQFPLKTFGLEQQCDHTAFPEGTSPRSISKNNVLSTPDFGYQKVDISFKIYIVFLSILTVLPLSIYIVKSGLVKDRAHLGSIKLRRRKDYLCKLRTTAYPSICT